MRKATKREITQLSGLFKQQRKIYQKVEKLCFDILRKNNDSIMIDKDLVSVDRTFDVYSQDDGSLLEYEFVGASIVENTISLFGIKHERLVREIESVDAGEYSKDSLLWVAGYLIDCVNGTLKPDDAEFISNPLFDYIDRSLTPEQD